MQVLAKKTMAWIESVSREITLLVGLVLLAFGLWFVYRPAALIVPGGILVAVAVFGVAAAGDRPRR